MEQSLRSQPWYQSRCRLLPSGECALPDSVLNVIFAQQVRRRLLEPACLLAPALRRQPLFAWQEGSELVLNGKGPRPINIQQTLSHMARDGLLGFFDKDFGADNLRSTALLCGHMFGLPYAGYINPWTDSKAQKATFVEMFPDIRAFAQGQNGDIKMAFFSAELVVEEVCGCCEVLASCGTDFCLCLCLCRCVALSELQIQYEAFWSARWAILAFAFVMAYMVFHTNSFFLATFGILQIILAFPCVYFVYYEYWDIQSMSIVNLMSLFVLCGIGTDDVFILTDMFVAVRHLPFVRVLLLCSRHVATLQLPRRHSDREGRAIRSFDDRTDRLVEAYKQAGSAMFVTSLTTAASFFSNVRPVLGG